MTTTDTYRLTETPDDGRSSVSRSDVVRALLWTVLVISVVANTVASYGDAGLWVHLACGGVTALCAGTLLARKLRGRR